MGEGWVYREGPAVGTEGAECAESGEGAEGAEGAEGGEGWQSQWQGLEDWRTCLSVVTSSQMRSPTSAHSARREYSTFSTSSILTRMVLASWGGCWRGRTIGDYSLC